ncbi:MAG: RcpC/CpaB family pilus assembly protein [Myxococcales bacterium]
MSVSGAEGIHAGDRVDVLAVLKAPATGEWTTQTAVQNVVVLSVGPQSPRTDDNHGFALRRVTLLVLPEEAESLLLAGQIGGLHLTVRNRDDLVVQQARSLVTAQTLVSGVRARALEELRLRTLHKALGPRAPDPAAAAVPEPTAQAGAPASTPQVPPAPRLPSRDEP